MAYSPRLIVADLLKSDYVATIALVHHNVVRLDENSGGLPWSQQIGYFFDGSHLCGVGEAHSLKVEKFLFEGKSDYQDVVVFEVSYTLAYLMYCPEMDGGVWSGCNWEFSMMVFFFLTNNVQPF